MNELIHKLSRRQWVQAMALSLFVVITLACAFLLYPQFSAYRSAQSDYELLADAVNNGEVLIEEIQTLSKGVASLSASLRGSASAMPPNQLEAYVVGQMQRVCWRNNVALRSIRPGQGDRISVFDEVLFDVEVSGQFFDIYAWLQDLNEELGFVVVRQFNLAPLGIPSANPVLTARFTLVAYREAADAA